MYSKHALRGWADYRAGLSYPTEYDTWEEVDQRNYENGRMRAANYRLATGRLPSNHVEIRAYKLIVELVGPAYFNSLKPDESIAPMKSGQGRG